MIGYMNVLEKVEALLRQQQAFVPIATHDVSHLWMDSDCDEKTAALVRGSDHSDSVRHAISCLMSIEFQDGQDGRHTLKQRGILMVGPDTIRAAKTVNDARLELGHALTALREQLPPRKTLTDFLQDQAELRAVLAKAGVSRLAVKQAKRALPILEHCPFRVSWLAKRALSITRIDIPTALEMLHKLNSEQAQLDVKALSRLSPGTPLAIVQRPYEPTLKATVFYRAGEGKEDEIDRRQIHAPLPILCMRSQDGVLPRLHTGGHRRKGEQRNDRKIIPDPYLRSIRAHLYEQ